MVYWQVVKNRVIELSEEELELWSSSDLKEHEPGATSILRKYWRSVKSAAEARKIVQELQADPTHELHPWSAAFISWIMKTAGAAKFKTSPAHRVYVADAKHNRENLVVDNPFWAYEIGEVKPEVGDLVCERRCTTAQYQSSTQRPKKCATFQTIDDIDANGKQIEWRTHCDIVTKVRKTSIDAIGGNVQLRVFKKRLALDPNGFLKRKTAENNQFIAIIKFRNSPTTMNARIALDATSPVLNSQPNHEERVTAGQDVIDFLERSGSGVGGQVRIRNLASDEFALFTVKARHTGTGFRIGFDGLERISLVDLKNAVVELDTRVTRILSEAAALAESEMIERLNGGGDRIAVLAPHGGKIEEFTDKEAMRVLARVGGDVATCWRCMGWSTGGASRRWHITSTEISERSYPLLGNLFDREYEFAVSFHGWTNSYIGVGGRAPLPVRRSIADRIRLALAGTGIVVTLETGSGNSGNNPKNIVNRLTSNGVQIEQPLNARRLYADRIADAVGDALRELL